MANLTEKELEFEREKFDYFKQMNAKMIDRFYYLSIVKFAVIIVLVVMLLYIIWKMSDSENFAPYASILAPQTINSTAGFDFPNQYGETTEPYEKTKVKSENKVFKQLHALYM